MISPKVSILVAVYNGSKTIDRCFQSIKDQTLKNFKIICIDDCSNDLSYELEKKWQKIFGEENFILIKNEVNIGLTKSLNKGLHLITTPYTARIDDDDWWHRKKLEKQLDFMEKNPDYGLVGCNYINLNKKKESRIFLRKDDDEIRVGMIRKNPFAHSCVFFKTEIIKKIGGYDESVKYGQDYDLWLRCMPECKFHNIQEFLCYRSTEEGISIEKQRKQMWQCIKTQIKYLKKYKMPAINYFYLLEPLVIIVTPSFIKKIKRGLIG